MKYISPIKKLIVFSQWSRKNYAVFASLGKIIKIGKVSADVSDKSLTKITSLTRSLNNILCLKKNLMEFLEELRQSEGIPDALVSQFALFLNCFVQFTSTQKEAKPVHHVSYNGQSPCFISDKTWTFLFIKHWGNKK